MWSLFNKSFSDSCGSSRGAVKATRPPKPISKKKEYDISAEEARKLADIGNEEKKKKELDDILKYIFRKVSLFFWSGNTCGSD